MNRDDAAYIERRYHLSWGDGWKRSARHGLPILERETFIPDRLVLFEKMSRTTEKKGFVIFNQPDRRIEPFWNSPERYVEALKRYDGITTPDFSLLLNMERQFMEANVLRALKIGRRMQELGLRVMVNAMWAYPDSYDYCFEALPRDSILFVSTVGSMSRALSREYLFCGLRALVERVRPPGIVLYGPVPALDFHVPVVRHFNRLSPVCKDGYLPELF